MPQPFLRSATLSCARPLRYSKLAGARPSPVLALDDLLRWASSYDRPLFGRHGVQQWPLWRLTATAFDKFLSVPPLALSALRPSLSQAPGRRTALCAPQRSIAPALSALQCWPSGARLLQRSTNLTFRRCGAWPLRRSPHHGAWQLPRSATVTLDHRLTTMTLGPIRDRSLSLAR